MSEIDFDELDKAVKQLMGGVTSPAPEDEPKQKTLTLTNTLEPGEKPTYDKLGKVAEGIGNETLAVAGERNTIETLSGALPTDGRPPELPVGNASAVVPPAALVRATDSRAAVAARPTRGRFMDVMHSSSDMTPPVVAPERPVAAPQIAPLPVLPEPTPIVDTPIPVATPEPSSEVTEVPAAATEEPVRTPFLPDTKVEKRPLGTSEPAANTDSVADVLADSTSKQFDVENALGLEQNVPEPAKQDIQALADPTMQGASAESLVLQKLEAEVVPADTEQPAGIYDVNSYHQPISHPAKRKSGWLVVLIIVVIIIVAAALGAGAYFMLDLGQ